MAYFLRGYFLVFRDLTRYLLRREWNQTHTQHRRRPHRACARWRSTCRGPPWEDRWLKRDGEFREHTIRKEVVDGDTAVESEGLAESLDCLLVLGHVLGVGLDDGLGKLFAGLIYLITASKAPRGGRDGGREGSRTYWCLEGGWEWPLCWCGLEKCKLRIAGEGEDYTLSDGYSASDGAQFGLGRWETGLGAKYGLSNLKEEWEEIRNCIHRPSCFCWGS